MTKCFKDHPCDSQNLYENTRPIAECESHVIELYDCQTLVTDVPILTCEGLWRVYQREAEEIVAPGGVLIADPIERNRVINAAYARLWLHDTRFQWAGLAAFASKQVGCGLLHAAESIENIEAEFKAVASFLNTLASPGNLYEPDDFSFDKFKQLTAEKLDELVLAYREYQQANANNPIPVDIRLAGEKLGVFQQQFKYVYDMMALGNTTLFLDIFPLHAFYKKRGVGELKICLNNRAKIIGYPTFPVLWPVAQEKLRFGLYREEIIQAFNAIEKGDIARSVELFASHEQKNILQPTIYEDTQLIRLLRANHASYVTGFPSGAAQAIELTLTSQCTHVDDGRTISFDESIFANLANLPQRMKFVLKAAARFDQMLNDANRALLEQSINEIAGAGNGI